MLFQSISALLILLPLPCFYFYLQVKTPRCPSAAAAATRSWSTTSSTSPSDWWTSCGRACSTRTPSWWWTSLCSSSGRYAAGPLGGWVQARRRNSLLRYRPRLKLVFFLEPAASRWPLCAASTGLRNKIVHPPPTLHIPFFPVSVAGEHSQD